MSRIERELDFSPLWIGVVGAAESGKSTFAEHLAEMHKVVTPYLALPIKYIGQKYYGMSHEDCYTHEGKKCEHDYITFEDGAPMTNRNVLEEIGDKLQEIDPLVLLRAVERRLENQEKIRVMGPDPVEEASPDFVAFPDLRTEPQAQFIRDNGGIIVYVQRDEKEAEAEAIEDAHHTKTFYNRTEYDVRIDNNGSLEDLRDQTMSVMKKLFVNALDNMRFVNRFSD